MNKLKAITSKAKILYKSGNYAKWTDAIKAASKIVSGSKTKIGYAKDRLDILKTATPKIRKYKQKGLTRKDAIREANIEASYQIANYQAQGKLFGIGSTTGKLAKQYLIDSIELDDYGIKATTDAQKVSALQKIFMDEYGWAVKRYGMQGAIKEWLMGIPSAVNIAFYNNDILKLARKWGTLPANATEKQEDKILKNYWNLMAANLVQLFNKYKGKVSGTGRSRPGPGSHKDSKSHNVNIRVVSGMSKTKFFI